MSLSLPARPDRPPRPDLVPPSDQGARPVPWGPLDAVPVFVLAIVFTAVAGLPALLLTSSGARFVLAALVGELGFLGAVVLWVRVVRRAPLSTLGKPRQPLRDVGMGLLAGAGLVVVGWVAGILVVVVARLILGK